MANFIELSTGQEQSIAAEIVHIVVAGNSIEIPSGLLNGQVIHLLFLVSSMDKQLQHFHFV
jgi:hypothetical protein